ncbi:macro domain-containing protein [bacterium]|nr:macro domain-containing protein [bacterium]
MEKEKVINNVHVRVEVTDITDLEIEAFVYYARSDLKLDAGYGNAITTRGGMSIRKELEKIGNLAPNASLITDAGQLKAKYIIHANGPKFQEQDIPLKLKTTMLGILATAKKAGITRLAFPAMGCGYYGIPVPQSAQIMLEAIEEFTSETNELEEIVLCMLDLRQQGAFLPVFNDFKVGVLS